MLECRECGAKYPTQRLFCGKCKERMGIRCQLCGFINLPDDLFCGICLAELKESVHVSTDRKAEEPRSPINTLYEEILTGAQEDEKFANSEGKISQEEIESIFQKDVKS
jgi:hypothetical protein